MELSEKFVRKQLELLKPITAECSLETLRKGQDFLGSILAKTMHKQVKIEEFKFSRFDAAWVLPVDEIRKGVVLYMHGGGYTCGNLEYSKGFASVLAAKLGIRVLCVAYRLAPENPFPAALDDALEAYRYLLSSGFLAGEIALCGESAGGGLAYSLCLRLKELSISLPCAIIAISPWVDLTASGQSYSDNMDSDLTLTRESLEFYASCYAPCDATNPLVSPIFGDMSGFPASLIFASGDEILLDDSKALYNKLIVAGCKSELIVAEGMWHAYVLYCIRERASDIDRISAFLKSTMSAQRKLRWLRLDNAAKIYPANKRRKWNNFFRVSATLKDPIDKALMQSALDITVRRFPSIAVRLCRGMFWYYLEELSSAPDILEEKSYPLAHAPFDTINRCAIRVFVYKNRVAVELFHALTDGNGGMIFLKTLLAEYILQRYNVAVPYRNGVFDRLEEPSADELEDSFLKYRGDVSASRSDSSVFCIKGTPERDGFLNLTTFIINLDEAKSIAKSYGVSLTNFFCSSLLMAIIQMQDEQVKSLSRKKPIRVVVPVNLRKIFPSTTLRNFVFFVTPEINPRLGDYSFKQICQSVYHQMGLEITPQKLRARFTANVESESKIFLKLMPLFIKNIAMKMVYDAVGERPSCMNLSNLGEIVVPDEMRSFVERFDFILGVQATKPNNCGMLSYNGMIYINFIRNTVEPELESHFFRVIQRLGLKAKVESNQREE